MSPVDEYADHYRTAVQLKVPDQLVVAVGLFTRATAIAADGTESDWVTDDVAIGLGTDHVVAVEFRPVGMEIETVAVVARWPRERVRASLDHRHTTRVLRLGIDGPADVDVDVETAGSIELHSHVQLGAFDHLNDDLYAQLGVTTDA